METPEGLPIASEIGLRADGLTKVRPQREAGRWTRLTFVLMGGLIALPAFSVGAQFASALGIRDAAAASFGGGLIVAAVAAPSAVAGARSRLSSYALIIQAFGTHGGKLINLAISFILIGWFGVIAMMFGRAVYQLTVHQLPMVSPTAWALAGVAMMTYTAIIGFKALDILSFVTLPFKMALLVWAVVVAIQVFGLHALYQLPRAPPFSVGTGASLLAGGVITGALLVPDICRFARSPIHAAVACGLAYGVGLPLVLILAAIPAQLTGQQDLVAIMVKLGLGPLAMLIVMMAGWTNNTYNLYSTTVVYSTLATRQPHWLLSVLAGAVGSALALSGVADHLTKFLTVLSICVPPVAGVFLANIYLHGSDQPTATWKWRSFTACLAGIVAASLETYYGFSVTSVIAVDALATSTLIYIAISAHGLSRAKKRRLA